MASKVSYDVKIMKEYWKWEIALGNERNKKKAFREARKLAERIGKPSGPLFVKIHEKELIGSGVGKYRITEYGVNPPWWSGRPIPPRGAEIYLRGTPEPEL